MKTSLLLPLVLIGSAACTSTGVHLDPVVHIHGTNGTELGVATDYGVVFLGTRAKSGAVEVSAWFEDGPGLENGIVEPLGNGLYTTQTEIRLPAVPMTFVAPAAGEEVTVIGRRGGERWEMRAKVAADPHVEGLVLRASSELRSLDESQLGAGVFVGRPGHYRLLGLVSGTLRIESQGSLREFLTVVGPQDLWRLVTYRRNSEIRQRWVYREDVL